MSKRRSEVQLTKDNFENESYDDVEIINEPKTASQETLKTRVFVKAKRHLASSDSSGANSSKVFSGFKGFSSFGTNNSMEKFNFGSSTTTPTFGSSTTTPTFGSSTTIPTFGSSTTTPIFGSSTTTPIFGSSNTTPTFGSSTSLPKFGSSTPVITTTIIQNKVDNNKDEPDNKSTSDSTQKDNFTSEKDDIFTANLTKLNTVFYDHIKKYMDKSMLYDFTVVCEEYISQYKKIKETKSSNVIDKNESNTNVKTIEEKSQSVSDSLSKFPPFPKANTECTPFTAPTNKFSPFSFGTGNSQSSNPLIPKFNLPSTTTSNESEKVENEAGGDEDVPPKVESVEHTEEDSVYTKKCKLYYKKDESFIDKGLSFLYIKVKDDAKPQLLIRSDTSTGNILLNIALVDSLPVIKADKNKGVLLTCIPNPEVEPKKKSDNQEQNDEKKTVTFLIRVKPADCEELYNNLHKYKSKS